MNEPLKHCPSCGSPAKRVWDLEEELVRCTNKDGFCHNSLYSVPINEWQNRPLEDALIARIAELEADIADLKAVQDAGKKIDEIDQLGKPDWVGKEQK